ncbi:hypothetical protein M1247_06225 [Mycobacterium sp. 21AC1]|uniref:hypothetical protein n=1 Tax=[Mycobacterium] appelbergii TaxID=2939269 RepID=UPI0029394AED|nr:hypothetical protein [Mycobacterium sp. 21AC1]MDV3124502.1 hypothetical protein [Mycobacterium sp. 21AC1]
MPSERKGGPVPMSPDELAAFLGAQPTGAICVTDSDGGLVALPARVLGQKEGFLEAEVEGLDVAPAPSTGTCVVADRFPSYEAIRGVIAQGSVASTDHAADGISTVAVAVSRTVTFSFANVTF